MAKAKAIFIPGTNLVFPSGYAAAKALGINSGNITQVLRGKRQTAGGYHFGYAENRTIYVPQTGQTFSSPKAAARSLGVKTGRVYTALEANSPTKGKAKYDFIYVDKTKLTPATVASEPTKARRVSRRKKRQEAKAQIRLETRDRKRKKWEKEKKKQEKRKKEKQGRIGNGQEATPEGDYELAKGELVELLEKINDKLREYYDVHPNFLYYNQSVPNVLAFQTLVGGTEEGYFDTSLNQFDRPDPYNKTISELEKEYKELAEKLKLLKQRIAEEATKSKFRFWDVNVAYGNRAAFALEFNISQSEMDEYANLIWDMFDIFEQANHYQELGSDLVYNAVRDSMQGRIPAEKLQNFLESISAYMENPYRQDLNEIFAILDGYDAPSAGIWDDEGWTI